MKRQSVKSNISLASDIAKPERGTVTGTESAFVLSRVYAEGWNAAKKLSASECDELDSAGIAALNPYGTDAKRQRWSDGFAKALGK
jgi:hypothetical protein